MFSTLISWNRWNEMSQFPHLLLSAAADFANFSKYSYESLLTMTHQVELNVDRMLWLFMMRPIRFYRNTFSTHLNFFASFSHFMVSVCLVSLSITVRAREKLLFEGSHGNKPDEQWVTLQLISTPCVAFWFLSELNVHIHFKRLWFSSKKCIAHSSPPNVKCEVIMTENDSILDPAATPERWNNWQKKNNFKFKSRSARWTTFIFCKNAKCTHSRNEQAFKFICTWWTAE